MKAFINLVKSAIRPVLGLISVFLAYAYITLIILFACGDL